MEPPRALPGPNGSKRSYPNGIETGLP
jgi:hypothetical protein